MNAPHAQRGVALLVALLAVALGTILLAMLLDAGGVSLARTRNVLRAEQADAYATGLEDWAIDLLRRDAASDSGGVDTRGDLWARPLPPTPVPGGTISGTMRDLDGCFNLNSLDPEGVYGELGFKRFERLLRAVGIDPVNAQAARDWVDRDNESGARGAEDSAYLSRDPPYRVANRRYADASELRLVRGFDGDAWKRIAPHVCALPTSDSMINVNTATLPVLMSLDERITEAVARRLAKDGGARYPDATEFFRELAAIGIQVPEPDQRAVTAKSSWFVARAEIDLDGLPMAYATMISRSERGFRIVSRNRAM